MTEDDDSKPPILKVVSVNPNARNDRRIAWAKEEVERTVALFAAALLRTMAGSNSEAIHLMDRLSDFLNALNKFREEAGRGLTIGELETALRLPQVDYESSNEEWRHRRWLREDALETIVKGALRLAAHKVLGEEPAFGGMHSERVIQQGIESLEELKRPLPPFKPQPQQRKRSTADDTAARGPKQRFGGRVGFGQEDLKELRKAIKVKDEKKIAELTAKIGKPTFDD